MTDELKEQLIALDVKDLTAGELYLHAVEHNLDVTKVKITLADRRRIESITGEDPLIKMVNDRVKEYRRLFEHTRGKGEQGQLRLVLINLLKFFRSNPQYTFDDLLKFTRGYINSFYGDYKIMRQADYFLYKYHDGMWISPVEEFIQSINKKDEESRVKFTLK